MSVFDKDDCTGWVETVLDEDDYRKNPKKLGEKRPKYVKKGKKSVL